MVLSKTKITRLQPQKNKKASTHPQKKSTMTKTVFQPKKKKVPRYIMPLLPKRRTQKDVDLTEQVDPSDEKEIVRRTRSLFSGHRPQKIFEEPEEERLLSRIFHSVSTNRIKPTVPTHSGFIDDEPLSPFQQITQPQQPSPTPLVLPPISVIEREGPKIKEGDQLRDFMLTDGGHLNAYHFENIQDTINRYFVAGMTPIRKISSSAKFHPKSYHSMLSSPSNSHPSSTYSRPISHTLQTNRRSLPREDQITVDLVSDEDDDEHDNKGRQIPIVEPRAPTNLANLTPVNRITDLTLKKEEERLQREDINPDGTWLVEGHGALTMGPNETWKKAYIRERLKGYIVRPLGLGEHLPVAKETRY